MEDILKIIEKNIVCYNGDVIRSGIIVAAKEINSMYMEFADFIALKVIKDFHDNQYEITGIIIGSKYFNSIEEIFEYWNKHIRKP